MKKYLYIDCQFFQTPVWDRGMGKYTMALLEHAVSKLEQHYELVAIFTKNMPQDPVMYEAVGRLLPNAKRVILDLKTTEKGEYWTTAQHNKQVLEKYIEGSTNVSSVSSAIFFIPCLFQEPTASVYPDNTARLMIYYDAIPFLYYQKYKHSWNYDNYLQRYRTLLASDTILTISETVKDDLAIYLGIENVKRRIVSIDGAAIEGIATTTKRLSIDMPTDYILLTTSDDVRKNNRSAIMALEQLRKISSRDFKMVITSSINKDHKAELRRLSPNLVFTGNVSSSELFWLYSNATAILCASEYEGLGLPVLEAVRAKKPIACSDIAVFREISSSAFYFFDPLNIEDMTLSLYEATEKLNWSNKSRLYPRINQKYAWQRTVKLFLKELDGVYKIAASRHERPKPKVAILCPTPSGYSSVGRTVQEIHDAIASHFEIDYYFEDRKKNPVDIRPNYLSKVTDHYEVAEFNAKKYSQYDAVIYHIGNSEYHFETIQNALYLPGIAIIHDTKLTECFGEMVQQGYMSASRYEAEAKLNELLDTERSAFLSSLFNNQIGAVIHSDYAHTALSEINLNQVIVKRDRLALPAPKQNIDKVQRKFVHVGLAGVLSGRRKGIDIIREMAKDPAITKNVIFHMFGFNLLEPADIEELKNYDNINLQTDLSDLAYQTQLANLDIMINYRSDYKGETSSSVLEAMRYGCVVIVNGTIGWFKELPDDSVVKVNDPTELGLVLRQLIVSPDMRYNIGQAAKHYVAQHHRPVAYGEALKQLFDQVTKSQTINAKRADIIKNSKNLSQVVDNLGKIRSQ